jgi:CheY-like chemotaxis protein
MAGGKDLNGARVLVLEDEVLVSMMIEDMLQELGCVVIGPFARLDDALTRISESGGIDLALLDVNVGGTRSYPAAEALAKAETPFIFSTGYDADGVPEEWRSRPALRKPFMLGELERALQSALGT